MKRLAIIVLAIAAVACAKENVRTKSPEALDVLDRLQAAADSGQFFFGQEDFVLRVFGSMNRAEAMLREVCGSVGVWAALGYIELGAEKLDGVPFE
jgi:hypothetical protein